MLQRKARWVFIFFVVLLAACATSGLKSFDDMTHKERATWMMGVYNSQARDYKALVARSDLTNSQKEALRYRKELLTQLWPLINTYTVYVDSGAVPTKEVEDAIIRIINEMSATTLPLLEGG